MLLKASFKFYSKTDDEVHCVLLINIDFVIRSSIYLMKTVCFSFRRRYNGQGHDKTNQDSYQDWGNNMHTTSWSIMTINKSKGYRKTRLQACMLVWLWNPSIQHPTKRLLCTPIYIHISSFHYRYQPRNLRISGSDGLSLQSSRSVA